MQTLLQIFQETKEVLCRYDYFYQNDRDGDSFFRNLPHRYEMIKIVRENKDTKRTDVIYQSMDAEQREQAGIEKCFQSQAYVRMKKL